MPEAEPPATALPPLTLTIDRRALSHLDTVVGSLYLAHVRIETLAGEALVAEVGYPFLGGETALPIFVDTADRNRVLTLDAVRAIILEADA